MSTVQRWQTPACLSLVLIAAILFVFSLGLRIDTRAAAGPATVPVDATTPAATPTTVQCLAPAATPVAPAAPAPAPVPAPFGISQNVSGSSNLSVAGQGNTTQGSDGGFGDVGMQFQNVNVLAPINIIHISNQGSGNTNTVNIPPSGPVTTTTTPATVAPATAVPATVDAATTATTTPTTTTTASTLPAKVWTPPTTPATTTTDPTTTTP
ncbi:MAG TPA: hypothetical protein VG205_13895 [Acidimicrobiales bacterium]|jgi:hypothetical protein|nr:hypothetical protein [Acidimicrobiales bacterium]